LHERAQESADIGPHDPFSTAKKGDPWIELHPIAASQGPDCRVYRIGVDQSAGDANIEQRPLSISPNGSLWNLKAGSLCLDAGELDHLAPLFGFVGDELAEVAG